jgi:hypothetical protein
MRSKGDVGYDEHGGSDSRRCEECVYQIYPDRCRQVTGAINSDGICDLFDKDTFKSASHFLLKGFRDKLASISGSIIAYDSSLEPAGMKDEDPAIKAINKKKVLLSKQTGGAKGALARD